MPVGVIRDELADGIELPRSRVFMYMRNAAAALRKSGPDPGGCAAVRANRLTPVSAMSVSSDGARSAARSVSPGPPAGEGRLAPSAISARPALTSRQSGGLRMGHSR